MDLPLADARRRSMGKEGQALTLSGQREAAGANAEMPGPAVAVR